MSKIKTTTFIIVFATILLSMSVKHASAAFFDRDKLAHAIALRFNLDEKEVASFLADFQYKPDTIVLSPAKTPNPSIAPSPTPLLTPSPTLSPQSIVKDGVVYQYDDGSDAFYPAVQVKNVQHQNHLNFIEQQLELEVKSGRISSAFKRELINELAKMMEKSPSSQEFKNMSLSAQRSAISKFRIEMDDWIKGKEITIAELGEITGKGSKYLMGIYFD